MRRSRWLSSIVSCVVFFALLSSSLTAPARAGGRPATLEVQSGDTLMLAEVLKVANQHYPLVLAAMRDEDAAESELLAARGGFDPIFRSSAATTPIGGYPTWKADTAVEQPTPLWGVSLFAGYRISSEKDSFAVYDQKYATNQFGEARAGARIPILRNGPIDKRRADIAKAELGVDIAKLGVAQQRLEVARVAAHRYWDWVAAGRRYAIAQTWLDLASKRDADIATRAASGDIAQIDRTENQRTILKRRAAVVAANRFLVQAGNELSLFFRDQDGSPIVPDPSRLPSSISAATGFEAPGLAAAEAEALARRPELARLDAQRNQARVDRDWARNQRLPAVDVLLSASKDFGPGDPKLDKPNFEASVLIDIPLLARQARGRAGVAESRMAKIDQQERLARDRITADVRNALLAVRTAKERAEIAEQEQRVAEQLEKAELEKLFAGASTLLIVNLREQATVEAGVRLVDALADYHKAVATYRAVIAAGT